MTKFNVGDEVKIIGNTAGHMFKSGTVVWIDRIDTQERNDDTIVTGYYCLPIGHNPADNYLQDFGWWCEAEDLEALVA